MDKIFNLDVYFGFVFSECVNGIWCKQFGELLHAFCHWLARIWQSVVEMITPNGVKWRYIDRACGAAHNEPERKS